MNNKELNLAICKEIARVAAEVWKRIGVGKNKQKRDCGFCVDETTGKQRMDVIVRQLNGRTLGAKELLRETDVMRNILVCNMEQLTGIEGMNACGELTVKVGSFSMTVGNANRLDVMLFNLDKLESLAQIPMKQRMMFGVDDSGTYCKNDYPLTAERLKEKAVVQSIGRSDYEKRQQQASQELLKVMYDYKDGLELTKEEFIEKYGTLDGKCHKIYNDLQKAKQRWHFAGAGTDKPKAALSPVLKQFYDLKKKHPDALLLFRCGDFYETYCDDAVSASKVLGITLTKSNKWSEKDGKPLRMAGFPYHALDTYLPKLIRAGHRVAICDQIETKPTITKVSSDNHIADANKKVSKPMEQPTASPSDTERTLNLDYLYKHCDKATLEIVKAIMAA